MATYSRKLLSGSTSGRPIPVTATATPGTTMHTAVAGSTAFDEVYAWFTNTDTVAHTVTIEWGGTGTGNQLVTTLTLPPSSAPIPIVTGEVLNGGLLFAVFADSASKVNVTGYVNSIA